jgi:hypothetical protein
MHGPRNYLQFELHLKASWVYIKLGLNKLANSTPPFQEGHEIVKVQEQQRGSHWWIALQTEGRKWDIKATIVGTRFMIFIPPN